MTRRSSICFSEVKPPPTWTVRFLPSSEKEPAGTVAPPAWRAWARAAGVQSGGRELLVVGGDGDLEVLDTVDGDLADAVDVLQGGDDGAVELVGERLLVLVGGDGEDDGRDVVRRTGDDLRVDVVGQLDAGAVDGLLDVGDELLRAARRRSRRTP